MQVCTELTGQDIAAVLTQPQPTLQCWLSWPNLVQSLAG